MFYDSMIAKLIVHGKDRNDAIAKMREALSLIVKRAPDLEVEGEMQGDAAVSELIRELGFAIIIVSALVMFALGWREAVIVVTAVPLTFALTLLVNYLAGYSINRVTLFAAGPATGDGPAPAPEAWPLQSKRAVADALLDRVVERLDARDAARDTGRR